MKARRKASPKSLKARATCLGIATAAMLAAGAAQAIPPGQRDFEIDPFTTNSQTLGALSTTSVTVNNGTIARDCMLTFSAETLATFNGSINLGYTIDNGVCSVGGGPSSFYVSANSSKFETSTAVHVKNVPAGIHTISPCIGYNSVNGEGAAQLRARTLIAQCRTR